MYRYAFTEVQPFIFKFTKHVVINCTDNQRKNKNG